MPRTRDARPERTFILTRPEGPLRGNLRIFFFPETLSWFWQTFQLPFNLAPDLKRSSVQVRIGGLTL
jgi:hypothetical protein